MGESNQADDGHTRDHASGLNDWGYEFTHDAIPSAIHRCYYTDFLAEKGKLQVYEDCARNYRLGQSRGLLRFWEHAPKSLERMSAPTSTWRRDRRTSGTVRRTDSASAIRRRTWQRNGKPLAMGTHGAAR